MRYTVNAWVAGVATQYEVEAKSAKEAREIARVEMSRVWTGGQITGVRPTGGKP